MHRMDKRTPQTRGRRVANARWRRQGAVVIYRIRFGLPLDCDLVAIPLIKYCGIALTLSGSAALAAADVSYTDLAPIFTSRCIVCHSGESAPLGLRLDSYDNLREGSKRGPIVKAGDPEGSELIRRLRGKSQPRMPLIPPPLPESDIARIENWIAAGLARGTAAASTESKAATPARPPPGEPVTYAHVAPILASRCAKCHTENGLMGLPPEGYLLTTYEHTLAASERARVVPGVPQASELVRRIRGQSVPRMPFDGPPYLNEQDIHLIEDWIAQGARDVNGQPAPVGARLRLNGRLTDGWALDGLALTVDGSTRIDKRPGVGDYVEVRAVLGPNGIVRARRIRRR